MTRKEFLKATLALTVVGCGGGGGNPNCGAQIQLNHGHALTVTHVEAETGVDKTYHIQAGADHDHAVTITAAQFAELVAGNEVTLVSGLDIGLNTHDHNITVSCA